MKIALYPRVSTTEQAKEGYSIKEQTDRMKKYCEAMGWKVYNVYTDAGYSGASTDRPGLQKMIKDVKAGKVDKVLVYKLDRLSRSQLDTLYLIEKVFLANGVDFVSMSENFDTSTPFGRAMIGILAVFAQLEREQIKERMLMGKEARAKEGKFHGSWAIPIGYNYTNGELIINDFEAAQIKEAYELAANGKSPHIIAKQFNAAGYTHKHGEWNDKSIRRILRQKTYIGYISHNGEWIPGIHTPIIDQTIYYDVQKIMDKRAEEHKKHNRRAGKATTYLGGFIRCGCCGAKYSRCQKKKNGITIYDKFICNSRQKRTKRLIKDPNCKNTNWPVDELTDAVFNEIRTLALDPEYINRIEDEKTEDTRPAVIMSEIEKIEKQISKLMDLYALDTLPLDVLQERIQGLNEQKNKLASEREKIMAENIKKISKEESLELAKNFDEVLERGDFDEIRGVISTLIEEIDIKGDVIDIHWNFV